MSVLSFKAAPEALSHRDGPYVFPEVAKLNTKILNPLKDDLKNSRDRRNKKYSLTARENEFMLGQKLIGDQNITISSFFDEEMKNRDQHLLRSTQKISTLLPAFGLRH